MKRKTFLDLVSIETPCEKLWDEMLGDEKVRHCVYCDKDIHNLSEMSAKEAEKLIFQSKGRVCVRMTRDELGKIVTNDRKFYQIKRNARIAASVLSITLALTTIPFAQTTNANDKTALQTQQKQNLLTLRIADENGGAISNAQVNIINLETKSEQTATSNADGEVKFVINKLGKYEIFINNAVGFKELRKIVDLSKENVEINLKLEVKESSVGNMVAVGDGFEVEKITSDSLCLFVSPKQEPNPYSLVKLANNSKQTKTSQISFTLYDPNGAVITNAEVKLIHEKTKQEFIVYTNQEGVAYFLGLPHGRYNVVAKSEGFHENSMTIEVKEEIEPNIKMNLSVGMIVGDIIVNWYEIPIFNSIVQKDYDFVKNYIASGKNVNIKDKNGVTLLHVAAKRGNFDLIKQIIDAGANVNAKDKNGETPILNLSSDDETENQWLRSFKLFIKKGADVNVQGKDEDTKTLLMKFCDSDETPIEVIKILLKAGADVNLKNSEGETALMFACDNDNLEIVKLLLEAKANPNFKDEDGETAMMKTDSEEIKNLLKKYGAKK